MEHYKLIKQGAEAKLYVGEWFDRPVIIKERFPKTYRHPILDKSLTHQRTKSEIRSMMRCRINGNLLHLLSHLLSASCELIYLT